MEVEWSDENGFNMETPREKTSGPTETKADRQSEREFGSDWNTRRRNVGAA